MDFSLYISAWMYGYGVHGLFPKVSCLITLNWFHNEDRYSDFEDTGDDTEYQHEIKLVEKEDDPEDSSMIDNYIQKLQNNSSRIGQI